MYIREVDKKGSTDPGNVPQSFRRRAFERWLEHGWSPRKIASYVVAGITTAIPVIGYIFHSGSPGAAWWLVVALGIACFWLATEVARWHIRHDRLPTVEAHARVTADLAGEQTAHLATKAELAALRAASEEAVQFHFWFERLRVDLNPAQDEEHRFAQFWFHFKSTADFPLEYRVIEGHVRAGDVLEPDQGASWPCLLGPKAHEDYGWISMGPVTQNDLRNVEVHLVVYYGRPNEEARFAMDCLISPTQCAWSDNGWPSAWNWVNKRGTTHEPV